MPRGAKPIDYPKAKKRKQNPGRFGAKRSKPSAGESVEPQVRSVAST